MRYVGQDGFKALNNFCVGEADDVPALLFEISGSFSVMLRGQTVGVAIDLEHHHRRAAGKIGDKRADYGLAAELDASEALGAQVIPEAGFGRS